LAALVATSLGHVAVEVAEGGWVWRGEGLGSAASAYNAAAAAAWAGYLAWRWRRCPGTFSVWGFGLAGFAASLRGGLAFVLPALAGLAALGAVNGRLPPSPTFWLLALLYPVWGLAQQAALQGLVVRNLRGWLPVASHRAAVGACLFSAAHFPNTALMALTFVAGVPLTLLYERHQNLLAVGLFHGMLGALAYHVVLGQDPGAAIVTAFGGG
jgi:hypothetical protein